MDDLRLLGGNVYIDGSFVSTNLYIKNGVISDLTSTVKPAKQTVQCTGDFVLPGIIDPHTHFNLDLGHIHSVDDFYHGTKAAAFGGVTTVIDFVQPAQTSTELHTAFHHRKLEARDAVIDVKLHACLKDPKDIDSIVSTMKELNLNTVKIFTTYSDSNRRTYDPEIRQLLKRSKTDGFTVTAHIENDDMIDGNPDALYHDLPDVRPTLSETSEALKLAKMVEETGGYLYMVHCSSGHTIEALKQQFQPLLNTHFIIESCPHYAMFNRDALIGDNGYLYTMAPPLRSKEEQELLQQNIDSIFTVGTDHCTFLKADKHHQKLIDMPLGVGGVEESFRVLYTMFGDAIIDKMTKNVAVAHHLYPQKGVLQIGSDADMFIYRKTTSRIQRGHGLCDHTIYQDIPVNGEVITTISRGEFVVLNQQFVPHKGRFLHE